MQLNKTDLMGLWGDKCKDLSSHFIKVDDNEIELSLKDNKDNKVEDFIILINNDDEYFFNVIVDSRNYFINISESEYEIMYNESEKWFKNKLKDDHKMFYDRWIRE